MMINPAFESENHRPAVVEQELFALPTFAQPRVDDRTTSATPADTRDAAARHLVPYAETTRRVTTRQSARNAATSAAAHSAPRPSGTIATVDDSATATSAAECTPATPAPAMPAPTAPRDPAGLHHPTAISTGEFPLASVSTAAPASVSIANELSTAPTAHLPSASPASSAPPRPPSPRDPAGLPQALLPLAPRAPPGFQHAAYSSTAPSALLQPVPLAPTVLRHTASMSTGETPTSVSDALTQHPAVSVPYADRTLQPLAVTHVAAPTSAPGLTETSHGTPQPTATSLHATMPAPLQLRLDGDHGASVPTAASVSTMYEVLDGCLAAPFSDAAPTSSTLHTLTAPAQATNHTGPVPGSVADAAMERTLEYIHTATGNPLKPAPFCVPADAPLAQRRVYCEQLQEWMTSFPYGDHLARSQFALALKAIDPSIRQVMSRHQLCVWDRCEHLCSPNPQAYAGKQGAVWATYARDVIRHNNKILAASPNQAQASETKAVHRYVQLYLAAPSTVSLQILQWAMHAERLWQYRRTHPVPNGPDWVPAPVVTCPSPPRTEQRPSTDDLSAQMRMDYSDDLQYLQPLERLYDEYLPAPRMPGTAADPPVDEWLQAHTSPDKPTQFPNTQLTELQLQDRARYRAIRTHITGLRVVDQYNQELIAGPSAADNAITDRQLEWVFGPSAVSSSLQYEPPRRSISAPRCLPLCLPAAPVLPIAVVDSMNDPAARLQREDDNRTHRRSLLPSGILSWVPEPPLVRFFRVHTAGMVDHNEWSKKTGHPSGGALSGENDDQIEAWIDSAKRSMGWFAASQPPAIRGTDV